MPDLETVINGLECCRRGFCFACPYNDGVDENTDCKQKWADDALALLKQQAQDLTDIHADLQESIADNLRLQELVNAQKPVKPTRYQEGRWFKTWRCGACGGTLVFRNGKDKPKYCIDCGRAVKWDG